MNNTEVIDFLKERMSLKDFPMCCDNCAYSVNQGAPTNTCRLNGAATFVVTKESSCKYWKGR